MNITLTDEQVASAIEQKLKQWLDTSYIIDEARDVWIHKHVCTVLNHAGKIMRTNIDDIKQELFKDHA